MTLSRTPLAEAVRAEAARLVPEVRALRRALHRRPEPSGREVETAAAIEAALRGLGLSPRRVGATGVVAEVEGSSPGPRLLLRADTDALEIQEETGLPFASEVPGMMHACGHDAHAAILVGAGAALSALRGRLRGSVRLLFQPHEETAPGGALPMIAAGVLDGVSAAVALHVHPRVDAGSIQVSAGAQTAFVDDVDVLLVGRGGHAAEPHEGRDPVVAAAALVQALQTVVARRIDPFEAAVVTVGHIEAGTRRNVIPERARLEGTVRTFSARARTAARAAVEEVCRGVAAAHGVEARVTFTEGYPMTVNDPRIAALVETAARETLGEARVRPLDRPTMGAEDFAYFGLRVPACLFRLGCGSGPVEARAPQHHPRFQVDEACLEAGVAVLAAAALRFGEAPAVPTASAG